MCCTYKEAWDKIDGTVLIPAKTVIFQTEGVGERLLSPVHDDVDIARFLTVRRAQVNVVLFSKANLHG